MERASRQDRNPIDLFGAALLLAEGQSRVNGARDWGLYIDHLSRIADAFAQGQANQEPPWDAVIPAPRVARFEMSAD